MTSSPHSSRCCSGHEQPTNETEMEPSFRSTVVDTTIQIWDEHKNHKKYCNAISPDFLNHNPCLSAAISARSCATWHSTKHVILNSVENKRSLNPVSGGSDLYKQQRREILSPVTLLGWVKADSERGSI